MKLSTRWDTVAGYRMFSRCSTAAGKDRPPVVLVHGLSMSSLYMAPVGQRLAREYSVYAPDLPGYGRSQKPPRPLEIADLARMLAAWLDHQHLSGPVYMLGNSMGCQIIVDFALQYPGWVSKAVLVGPSMDPRIRTPWGLARRAVLNMLFEPITFYPVMLLDYLAAGIPETFIALSMAINDPIEDKLARLPVPTLVTRGQHDWLASPPWTRQVAETQPASRTAVVPGGAHVSNFDAPARLARLADDFFQDPLK